MNMKTLSRMLLGAGLALMIFALFKDVTYGGYYNLHKASQQSNQLMLGGILFLAGIITLVATKSKGGIAVEESETVVSKEEIDRLKEKARQNAEVGKRTLNDGLHIFIARDETSKGLALRAIGGAVAGAFVVNIIGLFMSMLLSDFFYHNIRPWIYPFKDLLEMAGFALVLWYSLRYRDRLTALRNLFGIEFILYLLWFLVLYLFLDPVDGLLEEIAIFGAVCASGFVAIVMMQRKALTQA